MAEEKKNNNKPNEAKHNRQNNKEAKKETPKKNNEVDIEALKKAEYEKGKAEGSAEIEKFKFNTALDSALKGAKVRDSKTISGLLDMNKIKLENDKIVGLDDQLKTIRESHDYLFESDKKAPVFSGKTNGFGTGTGTVEDQEVSELKRIMGIKEEKQK